MQVSYKLKTYKRSYKAVLIVSFQDKNENHAYTITSVVQ